jgi:hypothetical protein
MASLATRPFANRETAATAGPEAGAEQVNELRAQNWPMSNCRELSTDCEWVSPVVSKGVRDAARNPDGGSTPTAFDGDCESRDTAGISSSHDPMGMTGLWWSLDAAITADALRLPRAGELASLVRLSIPAMSLPPIAFSGVAAARNGAASDAGIHDLKPATLSSCISTVVRPAKATRLQAPAFFGVLPAAAPKAEEARSLGASLAPATPRTGRLRRGFAAGSTVSAPVGAADKPGGRSAIGGLEPLANRSN